jgi:hypothetical protein
VLISMTTTFLTVRQSQKKGMMPAATPDNPMGQSQKYMMYIMPFFALSGLYWPFGLVLYWVTTNCWTLMQQWVLFRRFPKPAAAGAAGAVTSPAVAPVVTTRPKRPAKPLPAAPVPAPSDGSNAAQSNGSAKPAAERQSSNGAQPGKSRKAAGSPATGSAAKTSGAGVPARTGAQPSANGGGGAGGVLRRLGKRAEPEPEPPAPDVKLVRQQRQRQSRSKRSGKR